MEKIYGNAIILDGKDFEITRGYIVVRDGRIKEIGEGRPSKSFEDLKRGIVCPSFTNAHVHTGDASAQDYGIYKSIEERIGAEGLKFRVIEDKEKVKAGIEYALKEMKLQGTGAFADFREGGIEGVKLLKDALDKIKIKGVILGRLNGDTPEKVLEYSHGFGISSTDAYNFDTFRNLRELAKNEKKLFALHAGEVKDDIKEALKLRPDFIVHLTQADEESLEEIFKSKTKAVLCPRANATLAVGLPRIKDILENTLTAIGTDNVMINSLSMLREAEFIFKIARAQSRDYRFSAADVLKAATINGRKVLKLDDNSLEEDNIADFIVFKNNRYIYNPTLGIIHRFEKSDIIKIITEE